VVDLADGRVLGHEHPVPVADVSDVAEHHDAADHGIGLEQRETVHDHR